MSRFINTICEADYTARKVNKKTVSQSTGIHVKNRVTPNMENSTTSKKVPIKQNKEPINKRYCKCSGTGKKCAKHVQETKINACDSESEMNTNNFIYYDQSSLCLLMFIVITFLVRRNTDRDEPATDLDPVQAFPTRAHSPDLFNSQASGPARDPATPVDSKMLLLSIRTENKKNIASYLLSGFIYNFRLLTRILLSYWIPELADLLPDHATWVRFSISCENLRMCIWSRRG
jgi:hypothetical protein